MKVHLLSAATVLALAIAAAQGPLYAQVSGGAGASVGGDGASAGVGASIGGTGGVSTGGGASVGGDGASAGVGASIGGTGGVSTGGGATVGGNGVSAGVGAAIGGIGGVAGRPGSSTGATGNNAIGTLAALSPGDLRSTLGRLSSSDISKLKTACSDVLANPTAYAAETLAVCQVISSI